MKTLLLILILFVSTNIFSYDWEAKGYNVKRSSKRDIAKVTDTLGREYYIKQESLVDDEIAKTLGELNSIFYRMKYIKVSRLIYNIKGGTIRVLLIPKTFVYNDTNMVPHVTAGLIFDYSSDIMSYNFRIKSKDLFMKLTGAYIDEELLCKKIEEVLKDPKSYIARRDSEYLLNKLEELEGKVLRLEEQGKRLTKSHNSFSKKTKADLKKLEGDDKKIRAALISFQNDRFFAGEDEIDDSLVKAVLRLRNKYPTLSLEEFMEKVDEAKIDLSEKEVKIILIAYRNEFEKKE